MHVLHLVTFIAISMLAISNALWQGEGVAKHCFAIALACQFCGKAKVLQLSCNSFGLTGFKVMDQFSGFFFFKLFNNVQCTLIV